MKKQWFIRIRSAEQLESVQEWMQKETAAPVLILDCDLAGMMREAMASLSDHVIYNAAFLGSTDGRKQHEECFAYLCLPDVGRQSRIMSLERMIANLPEGAGLVVRNPDELGILLQMGYQGPLIGDAFLYAYNKEAMLFYLDLFPRMQFILSDELTDRELKALTAFTDPGRFIYKIYGYQPLMITNQCMSKNYTNCREKKLVFTDSKGGQFTAVSSCSQCSSTIFNGKCTSMQDRMEEIGYPNLLIDLTIEDKKEVLQILHGKVPGEMTRGHHYKGID